MSSTCVGDSRVDMLPPRGSFRRLHLPAARPHNKFTYPFSCNTTPLMITSSPSVVSFSPSGHDASYISPEASRMINRQRYLRSYTFSTPEEPKVKRWFRKKISPKKHAKKYCRKSTSLKSCLKLLSCCFVVRQG